MDEGTIEEIAEAMASKNICLVPAFSIYRAAIGKLVIDKRKYSKYINAMV